MARRLARITAVLLLAAAAFGFHGVFSSRATPGFPQAVGPSGNYTSVAGALSKFIQHEMEDKKLPAFSIALVDDQQVVWAQGFGYADPEKKTPASPETVYRIGSVSKLFTDIGVMQLVERGELDLDAPIQKYLPDFKPHNPFHKDITLRQLMSHRAGLLREPPVGNYFDPSELSLSAMVHSLNDTTLVYPPESHTKYSNAGVATVGYVLEKHSRQPFASYLRHAVLEPIGLRNSAFQPEPELIARLSKAYMWSYDGLQFQAPKFELGMAPAGCMYSTVLDLGRFLSVLFNQGQGPNGRVLQAATLEMMRTPQFVKPDEKSGFGIGFYVSQLDGHRVVEHGGAIYGFATQAAALPDDKLGVVAVTTMDSSNAVTSHVAEMALRLMLAAKESRPLPEIPETSAIPPERVRQLEARYGTGDSAVNLIAANSELYLRRFSGGEQVRLRQSGHSLIEDSRLGYGLQVTPVANGIRVRDHLLERVSLEQPPPIPSRWKGLIGEYGWDYDKLYIFEENGKLSALIEWFDFAPLAEVTSDVFDFPHSGLYDGEQAVFTRDTSGQATQVKVSGVIFKRRPLGSIQGGIFHVTPQQPLSILTKQVLAAQPPHESGDFLKPDLIDLSTLDPTIHFDIRYATKSNFLGEPVYSQAKSYTTRPRNFTPCGIIKGGASSLVASTIAWSSLLFNSKLVNIFLFSLSSMSARSITTNRRPVTIARAIWNATPNRNCSDSERDFNNKSKWPSIDERRRIWNGSSARLQV
jgi:CubicO group peptidase (beta-lactamase class C family)